MRDRHDCTPPSPANAFDRAFLDVLDPEDDPMTATEAAAEGPWTVVLLVAPKDPLRRAARARAVGGGARGEAADEAPAATLVHLHPARLAAAAVAIAAREPAYRLGPEQDPRGFALRQDGRVVGHLPWHHQELVATLNVLDALARSPRALAAVLEAAGATAIQRVGALLARRSL